MSITQLAVFEAVNAITGEYEPYLGTVVAPRVHRPRPPQCRGVRVLKNYFPAAAATLDTAYAASLAAIPNGSAKTDGIATGEAAAAQMIALRAATARPAEFYLPTSSDPGVWQTTPSCPPPVECFSSGKTSRRSGSRASPAARLGSISSCRVRRRRSPAQICEGLQRGEDRRRPQ